MTIKNLESIQDYRAPPEDFSLETLTNLETFLTDLQARIAKQKQLSEQKKFFEVLRLRNEIEGLSKQAEAFKKQIKQH